MNKWKLLIPPAAVPLALWMFVAVAGPGGVHEIGGGTESTPAVAGADGDTTSADSDVAGDDAALADGPSTENGVNGGGCEEALLEQAQARPELEGHVADGNVPATGAEGNQNALDKQCGGAFAEGSQAGTTAAGQTDPGKSEQAPAAPAADGQAQGQGRAGADSNGNGPADAPGQNKP